MVETVWLVHVVLDLSSPVIMVLVVTVPGVACLSHGKTSGVGSYGTVLTLRGALGLGGGGVDMGVVFIRTGLGGSEKSKMTISRRA